MRSLVKQTVSLSLPLILLLACSSSDYNPELEHPPVDNAAYIPKMEEDHRVDIPTAQSPLADAMVESSNNLISLKAKNLDCAHVATNECNPDEPSNRFRCSLTEINNFILADDQQLHGRGDSRCFAQKALESKLCSEKILLKTAKISCHPDNTPSDECAFSLESCDAAPQVLTKCFVKETDAGELAWTNRPESWGKSECEARKKLTQNACNRGLAPSEIKSIVCEKEVSPLVCPPIQENCLVDGSELIECRIRKIGDSLLQEPLKGFGTSMCEANYRVKDLACRAQRKDLSDSNDLECRSVSRSQSFSTTPETKIYKTIKRL